MINKLIGYRFLLLMGLCVTMPCAGATSPAPGKATGVEFQDQAQNWHFTNGEFELFISKKTGLLERLVSLKPSPLQIIPQGGSGLTVCVENLDHEWLDELNSVDTWKLGSGVEEGREFLSLTCALKPSDHKVATATIEYRVFEDRLGFRVKVDYLVDDPSLYRVGVYQPFDPNVWTQQQHLQGPSPSTGKETVRYSFRQGYHNDEKWYTALYPMSMLISHDRYFLWGYLDLGGYVVLAKNLLPNTSPSFMVSPQGIAKGKSYTFDFIYKTFPRPENSYVEVLRWYAEHFYDSDPDFNQGPVRLEHKISRTIGEGNMGAMDSRFSMLPGAEMFDPRERILEMEDIMKRDSVTHLWYGGWNDWRESAQSSGTFVSQNLVVKVSAEDVKAEIRRLQRKGFKVYLYFRQAWWFTKSEWESDKEMEQPPYKKWLNKTPDGKLVQLWCGPKGYYPADTERAKKFGINEPIYPGEVDFNNDEARAWYFKRLKECVEYYNADGVAFDFGWSVLAAGYNVPMFSAADPNSDMFQGQLKIQYEVYKWLQKNHPDKRMLINNVGGAPSQLYADGILLENGTANPHDNYANVSKAFNTTLIDLVYAGGLSAEPDSPEVERTFKTMANVTLAAGMSYATSYGTSIPHTEYQLSEWLGGLRYYPFQKTVSTDLTGFSAKTNAVPLVTSSHILSANSPEVVGSVWANEKKLLIAIYNNDSELAQVDVSVARSVLKDYNQVLTPMLPYMQPVEFNHLVINADGKARKDHSGFATSLDGQCLRIKSDLGKGELLLVERK